MLKLTNKNVAEEALQCTLIDFEECTFCDGERNDDDICTYCDGQFYDLID